MHPLDDSQLRAWFRDGAAGGPALFLDRDGVIVEEVQFLRRAQDVRLMPGVAAAVRSANEAGVPVVCVTNQSGIARGLFGWADYAAVTAAMAALLEAGAGARLDAVLACGHSADPGERDRHGWRKPAPGMLYAARDRLGLDLARSVVIGDRVSDLEAGRNAGLAGGLLVLTGYGREHAARLAALRPAWHATGFWSVVKPDPHAAIAHALHELQGPAA